jgi:hypothetical protein
MKSVWSSIVALSLSVLCATAQNTGPYHIKSSEVFKSPKRHQIKAPIGYGKEGIVQVSAKGSKSFAFQLFSNELRYERAHIMSTESKLNEYTSYNRFIKLKNKTYLFVRDVNKDAQTEGISALEFHPKDLNFGNKGKSLFQSSGKIRIGGGSNYYSGYSSMGFGYGSYPSKVNTSSSIGTASDYNYNFVLSTDKTNFLYTYSLVPKEKRDALNKDVIGMYVFDEDLNKQWGGEFEMPYTEAKMDNLGYTVGNDSKVYLLAKVYETERPKETDKNSQPNFHFEVLVYDKGVSEPAIIKLKLDEYFPKEVYIYEDAKQNIVVAGFYGKSLYGPILGAYLVKLDIKDGVASKINGDFYEIPKDIIKSYVSDREKRKLEKRENKDPQGDIGVNDLKIRKIYEMPNGSTKIVSEQYVVTVYSYYDFNCKCYRTRYDTYADDIFVISIAADGRQEWVKKIPKAQHSSDAVGEGLSINSLVTGNDLHIFYIDNIKNLNLSPSEAPKMHMDRRGGFLTAVDIDETGNAQKYSLGEIAKFKTNFLIRGFVDGGNNNLISTERKRKKNKLVSIEVNGR